MTACIKSLCHTDIAVPVGVTVTVTLPAVVGVAVMLIVSVIL